MHRVLVVDQEHTRAMSVSSMLTDPELTVDTACDASMALPMIDRQDYDVVVSDYVLPQMDGVELLARVCDRRPDTMRILVTATCDLDAAVGAINRGEVLRLLRKPLDPDEVRFTVRLAVETRQLRARAAALRDELGETNRELRQLAERLESMVERRTADLLDALIGALDFRDNESHRSSRRVSRYARRLAQELCLPDELVRVVEQGALLHDIGKIGVPDAILHKPGKLDEKEWAEMRRHPALGWEILRKLEFLAGAREIVLQHRERFDGAGYPAGLAGEGICVGARIFAVVDTFDAITSDRPYRRGVPYSVARGEIERVAGTQLDPWVVEAFLRIDEQEWSSMRRAVESEA